MLLAQTASGSLAFLVLILLVGGVIIWQRRRMEDVTRRLEQRDEYRRPPAGAPGEAPPASGEPGSERAPDAGSDGAGDPAAG